MAKRTFDVELIINATAEIEDAVIDVVDDEWRSKFYDLESPEEIAKHITYNLIVNRWALNKLDGWADQPAHYARVDQMDIEIPFATEVKP